MKPHLSKTSFMMRLAYFFSISVEVFHGFYNSKRKESQGHYCSSFIVIVVI